MKIQILHKTSISLISVENPSLCRSSQPPPIKSSRNAILPFIYPKYFPFAIITFLVNLNIHQIPLPRFILKVYCPIKLLNNELVCVMTQHRKVAADENIFVNTHNERRGGDGEKWGDNAAAGNMLSWRRLACREAAVRPQAYLMLFRREAKHFPLPIVIVFFLAKLVQTSRKTGKNC